ncbi:uncharacterized protein A1O9_04303 [Exophiala aquamarina CBS 119918]|uniref:Pentatricopeptide repeat domain-containing protein n=1 Tax=Exophiala aquamarina CBS 119918 TaxID=1182545 RepID=A0A072PH57_9EURO|nr:uncharacterized protein A1O9_04303 [Exophiala aquamarina CBS 119918]KEF59459.1 hypothetical protein A1O9_04303 [Exophiala aquamarina CBS 119918]
MWTQSEPPESNAWEDILTDAFMFGLRTKEELLFQADVGHCEELGSRLVDGAPGRQNIELWLILLRTQALQNGHEGIKTIWKGLQMRGPLVQLHDDDPRVNSLWNVFLAAGTADPHFLRMVCTRARENKFVRPAIFTEIVGAALEGIKPEYALKFADYLSDSFRGRDDLIAIFLSASKSDHPDALKVFCKVYDRVPQSKIYSSAVPLLWEQDRPSDAIYVHLFLLSRGDLPDRFELLQPFIRYLISQDQSATAFTKALTAAGASFEAQIRHFWATETSIQADYQSISQNLVASKLSRPTHQKLTDHFVARAFATRAFSFEFAVNNMRMLGLVEVGPLAVREMALSAHDASTLRERFRVFRELGIDTGSSVFVRTIQNATEAGQWDIVQSLANSDVHHEDLADRVLQERLLTQYYRESDWLQVNRTLAVINMGRFGDQDKQQARSILLLTMLRVKDYHAAIQLVSNMRQNGQQLYGRAIPQEISSAVRQWYRQPPHQRTKSSVDQLAFFIGLLQDLAASGTYISLETWRIPLIALAQAHRLESLERLSIWIAEWYRPGGFHSQYWKFPLRGPSSDINKLWSAAFQRMLVSWCFRIPKGGKAPTAERCLRWAPILKRLRDKYGVSVNEGEIWWTFARRLRKIFSISSYSFIRHQNRRMRSQNQTPLWQYWHMYKVMWEPEQLKPTPDGTEAVIRGLYSTNRAERKWERKRQHALRFEDTHSAAAIRASLAAKQARREGQRVDIKEGDTKSTIAYGRVI